MPWVVHEHRMVCSDEWYYRSFAKIMLFIMPRMTLWTVNNLIANISTKRMANPATIS
ncbi:MAG: hypothetical protein LBH02_00340 [Methanocalculaceae archaeon]|nr:hypothetical protein [Methanocalculaceae archaeon]